MKKIGLLGGTSWPSTMDYYATINRMVLEKLGGFHSAEIILRSIDYHEMKSRYGDRWNEVAPLLKERIEECVSLMPDVLLICNNTLHKAFDEISSSIDFGQTEFVHIVDETGWEANRLRHKNVLLLGTKLTMEDGYYANKLTRGFNLTVEIPSAEDREEIQCVQSGLMAGSAPVTFKQKFRDVLVKYKDYDAIVLACTELPLVVGPDVTDIPILNPTYLQCRRALELALS